MSDFENRSSDSDSDSDSGQDIDYPDASEVFWSDDEEIDFHIRDSSICSPRTQNYDRFERTDNRRRQAPNPVLEITSLSKQHRVHMIHEAQTKVPPKKTGDQDCPICLETCFPSTQHILYCSTECGNLFHLGCMVEYTKPYAPQIAKCPLCRIWSKFITVGGSSVQHQKNKYRKLSTNRSVGIVNCQQNDL